MTEAMVTDVRALVLESDQFSAAEAETLREILANDSTAVSRLREVVGVLREKVQTGDWAHTQELKMRLGVVEYLLGWTGQAIEHLQGAPDNGLAQYYLGRGLMARGDAAGAIEAFQRAGKHGYNPTVAALCHAGALRAAGKRDQAMKLLEQLEPEARETAEYHFQLGCCLEETGERASAIRHYEQALEIDLHHPDALFRCAFLNDLYGNDEDAIMLYERCLARAPVHMGAVFNLGVLYEDRALYDRAARCFQRVLTIYPSHPRARLFFKDCRASYDMYADEDAERRHDRLSQLLLTPVTDFELSVRSRNCLRKMDLMTLGDLVRTSEVDLLGSKNFGETSLLEIKELLASKGLRIGMFAEEQPGGGRYGLAPDELTAQERAAMAKPITELNLSVRARKCMARLGITTIGQLASQTPDQLLEVKNFGVTSLTEVRQKLSELGLKLQGD